MQYIRLFLNICLQSQILFIISLMISPIADAQRAQRTRPRLCSLVTIPNGNVRFRHNYKIMRIVCAQGFTIQGSNIVACENGKWNSASPVCAKEGCKIPETPPNGLVLSGRFTANLYCREKYKVAGGRVTYCNGTNWDRPLGECRETNDIQQLMCDFETDDLCGWSHDETHNFDWKRIMAANMFQQLRTGPTHDHTTLSGNAGHYMLMESFDQLPHSVSRLLSPIYPKNVTRNLGCFKFYYYMYGATVGSLNVYVKPVSLDMDQMLQESRYRYFTLSGNQKNIWREAMFTIEEMSEDFQIVVEGTAGSNHLSDIAIDDVQLMTYFDCNADSTTLKTQLSDYTEYAIYDIQSCEGRCNEMNSTGYGIINIDGRFVKMCDCHLECENFQTCCPNYRTACEFENTESSTEKVSIATNAHSKENSISHTTTTLLTTQATASIKKSSQAIPKQKTTHRTTSSTEGTTTTTTTDSKTTTTSTTIKPITVKATVSTESTTPISTPVPNTIKPTSVRTSSEKTTITEWLPTPYITPSIFIQNPTSENNLFKKKEKVIYWQVRKISQSQNNTVWNILTIIVIVVIILIVIIIILLKYKERIWKRRHHPYQYRTTLIYNQSNEIILQN